MVELLLLIGIVAVFLITLFVFVGWVRRSRRGERASTSAPAPAPAPAPPAPAPPAPAPAPAPPAPAPAPAPVEEPLAPRRRFRDRLGKARGALDLALAGLLRREVLDQEAWDDLEEALIRADVGLETTTELLSGLESRARRERVKDPGVVLQMLKEDLTAIFADKDRELHLNAEGLSTILMVGVNGAGKTTTIAKLARRFTDEGKSVVLAAADTFRAAAAEQLEIWGERVGAPVVRGQEGADPGSVVYDAADLARARDADILVVDTAGRLHTKVNLMEELKKVKRVIGKANAGLTETLLVLDATTGQNGLVQARQFSEAVETTGVVLTKLDGTARGGIVVAVEKELSTPVKLVGLGESAADLVDFNPAYFVDALFE